MKFNVLSFNAGQSGGTEEYYCNYKFEFELKEPVKFRVFDDIYEINKILMSDHEYEEDMKLVYSGDAKEYGGIKIQKEHLIEILNLLQFEESQGQLMNYLFSDEIEELLEEY